MAAQPDAAESLGRGTFNAYLDRARWSLRFALGA
jgi:hypothetical protein